MKYGIAVVVGALVMFASGYMLGYTTALPDILRAASVDGIDPSKLPVDVALQGEIDLNEMDLGQEAAEEDQLVDEQLAASELEHLKRMIVPMMTDEEIKRIRAETSVLVPADSEQPAAAAHGPQTHNP